MAAEQGRSFARWKGALGMAEPAELLTVEEACEVVRIGRTKAYELVRSEWAPFVVRVGRLVRIPREGLDRWLSRSRDLAKAANTTPSKSGSPASPSGSSLPSARGSATPDKLRGVSIRSTRLRRLVSQ